MKPMPDADEHRRLGKIEAEIADQLPAGTEKKAICKTLGITNQARTRRTGGIRAFAHRTDREVWLRCAHAAWMPCSISALFGPDVRAPTDPSWISSRKA
jgi:hypothetical protein